MRSLIVKGGLVAALLAAPLAVAAAPAAAADLAVAWGVGRHWGPGWGPYPGPYGYDWPPRPAWYGTWWPRYPATYPVWPGDARVATVRRELAGDDARLRNDRLAGRLDRSDYASLAGEDSAIRAETDRDAALYGGLSGDAFLRLQGEVHALSGEIARLDGGPFA